MDNQKSNDGNARNVGSEGSGSSMGKDLSKDTSGTDHITSKTVGMGNLDKGLDKPASASGSTQDKSMSDSKGSPLSGANMDRKVEKTATSAHDSIDKAAEAVQPMADRLASSAHASVDKVSDALTGVSDRMEEKTKQLSEAYGKFAETGRDYVRSSPATSVLVALAAGYTLSKIFGGRRH